MKNNLSIAFYSLLMLCGAAYLLGFIVDEKQTYSVVWWFSSIGSNALPGLFWLVSLSVFGDHVRLKPWQYSLASFTLLASLLVQLITLITATPFDSNVASTIRYSLLFIELALIIHALITALKYWREDLVQERRYVRGGILTLSALYLFLVIIIEQLFSMGSDIISLMKVTSLALLITGINFLLFNLRPSSLFETISESSHYFQVLNVKGSTNSSTSVNMAEDITDKSPEHKNLKRLVDLMEKDKFYQQENATISNLAKQITIQENKLRALINGEMNFRNFNDFLNFYRIKEISHKLDQEALSHIPVLTFALESGFRSLSTFNKAFKETHGITPTQYRKNIKDS